MSAAAETFTVMSFDAASGWDTLRENVSRREAWTVAHSAKVPVTVHNAAGDEVWANAITEYDEAHSAWLSRTPN